MKIRGRPRKIKNKVVAIIQARMGSTRLPGKVLKEVLGVPVLKVLISRIKLASRVHEIIVATTTNPKDREIVDFCKANNILVTRGSEEDVLGRMVQATQQSKARVVVDITGDCPLVDPNHIDQLVDLLITHRLDYASNVLKRSWPDGFDIQVYTQDILKKVSGVVTNQLHRGHSGWNIPEYKDYFLPRELDMFNVHAPEGYILPDWGMTLDTEEDFEVLTKIFEHFKSVTFSAKQAVDFLADNPKIRKINSDIKRRKTGEG